MIKAFEEGEVFEKVSYQSDEFRIGEYSDCEFIQCNFSGIDISQSLFENCLFVDCDLSMTNIDHCGFQQVRFENCKMIGWRFENTNPFSFYIQADHCQLNLASFYKIKAKGLKLTHCQLVEADFTEAQIPECDFSGSDLSGAIFNQTVLEKCRFEEAQNFSIDPRINQVKGAHFASNNLTGLVDRFQINIHR